MIEFALILMIPSFCKVLFSSISMFYEAFKCIKRLAERAMIERDCLKLQEDTEKEKAAIKPEDVGAVIDAQPEQPTVSAPEIAKQPTGSEKKHTDTKKKITQKSKDISELKTHVKPLSTIMTEFEHENGKIKPMPQDVFR